jgi:hypothetical protein
MMFKPFNTLSTILLISLLSASHLWAGAGKITGARLDELDLYEDATLTQSKTVDASKLHFPIEIEEATPKAFKIPFEGRSYWVIRGMVESEGVGTTARREAVKDDAVGATRGLGGKAPQ